MDRKREIVKGKNLGGKDVEVAVLRPSNKVMQDAQLQYNLRMASLIRQGVNGGERLLLRHELDKHLEQLGIWTREDAAKYLKLNAEINTCVTALRQGGVTLSEGRSLALHIGDLRNQLLELYSKRSQLDGTTIEAVAENHKFDFLVSQCVVHADTGALYFAEVDDYVTRKDEPVAVEAAGKLAQMLYGYDDEYLDKLPEAQWMKKYGFANETGRLTNRNGQLVDRDGKLVNERGEWIDEEGHRVDYLGRRIDENGELIIETKPFIDEETGKKVLDGKEVEEPAAEKLEPETPTRRRRRTKKTEG